MTGYLLGLTRHFTVCCRQVCIYEKLYENLEVWSFVPQLSLDGMHVAQNCNPKRSFEGGVDCV